MKLSVCICTWNRAKLLRRALERLANVVPPASEWEVLVVNNNSTDETGEVIEAFRGRLPLRGVFVPEQGLSHARNAGVQLLSGDYVVWTDDDVLVDPGWLVAYEQAFRQWPEAAIFGGPIQPCFEGRAPGWLLEVLDDVGAAFALRDFGANAIPLDGGVVTPYGANFAVRLREQREFSYDPELGKKLNTGLLGEEVAVIRAMMKVGHTGWWVPNASVQHVISKDRQTLAFLRTYYTSAGRTVQRLNPAEGRTVLGRPVWLWRKALTAEIAFRIRRYGGNPRKWIGPFRDAAYYWGMLNLM